MTEELQQPKLSVSDMLRTTGTNTAEFMIQVAAHIDVLEQRIRDLEARLSEQAE